MAERSRESRAVEAARKVSDPERNPFFEFLRLYRDDPVRFVREVLGAEPDEWQAQFLEWIANGERRISVRSGHGVGKSTAAAWAMVWYALTRYPFKIVVTAPTSSQLWDAMFAELKAWIKKLPKTLNDLLEVKSDRVALKARPDEAFISARTSRAEQPEALQGVHCFESGTVDVLTAKGWVPLEDVTTDDWVMAKRPFSSEADYEQPERTVHTFYEGELHRYEGRFLRYSVTPGHKFEYLKRQANKTVGEGITERWEPYVRPVSQMQRQPCKIPTTVAWQRDGDQQYTVPEYVSLRYGKPLRTKGPAGVADTRPPLALDMGDWAEFIGCYLAEGSLGKQRGKPTKVSIGQVLGSNPEKHRHIGQLVERMGFYASRGKTSVDLSNVQVATHVAEIVPGHSAIKRVPAFAFTLSPEHIRRMLDGMRRGDGWGDYQYHTSSPGMAEDIQRLIVLAGGYATINFSARKGTLVQGFAKKTYRNGDYYRVREWYGRSVDTAMIRPEKRRVEPYSGYVSCLTMPSGMFYVRDRKTSKPFWTHNSENVLLIADEASGVPEAVFEAAAGSMSGESATTILLGNPTKGSGFFYDTHHRLRNLWKTLRVSCHDSKRVSKAFIEDMKTRYGEDSNAFRIRVLGEFPTADDDTVISLELVEAAMRRDVQAYENAPTLWGVDVARFGDDKSALAKRKSNELLEPIRKWTRLDTMQLTGAIKAEWDAMRPSERPAEILVDAIGIGAGVADRLRELGLPARAINVSESPGMQDVYLNLRAELWFKMRDWLAGRQCRMPEDENLTSELVTPRYKFTSSGKIQIESKEDMKKRGLPSPDGAEAFMLTFAADAVVAQQGNYVASWNKPLRRNVPIV